jgi:hypothetical protein
MKIWHIEIVSVFFIHVDTIQEEKANFKEE